MYDGRSINKLQNGVILLIFKMWKFWNIRFVSNLILSMSCEFYFNDISVTSFINIRYCNIAVESIPQGTAFCYLFPVCKELAQMPFTVRWVHAVYGTRCFTRPATWCKKFANGWESVADEERPGRCVVSMTDAMIAAVDSLLQSDRRVME